MLISATPSRTWDESVGWRLVLAEAFGLVDSLLPCWTAGGERPAAEWALEQMVFHSASLPAATFYHRRVRAVALL
jgi:hypothetical protein